MRSEACFLPSLFLQICVNENSLNIANGTINGINRGNFSFTQ
jgi:hypothetical protein